MHVELNNLPRLTIPQANAIEAYFSGAALHEAATIANMSLAEFLDTLADEQVQAHLEHARRISSQRTAHRLTDAAYAAAQVLEAIATNADNDPTERRRAASTILRALNPSRPRRRRAPRETRTPPAIDPTPPNARPPSESTPSPGSNPSHTSDTTHESRAPEPTHLHATPAPAHAPQTRPGRRGTPPPDR